MHLKQSKDNTDKLLFKKIKEGDYRAFESLFKDNYVHLVAFANSFLHDMDNAENVVQNVYVKLWEKKLEFEIVSLKGYLFVAVRNSCYNEIKRLQKEREYKQNIPKDDIVAHVNYSDSKILEQISAIINQLPEQRKRIFKLNRLEGLKYREIAVKLNISPKTVEVQMGKALKFLRHNLMHIKKHIYHI